MKKLLLVFLPLFSFASEKPNLESLLSPPLVRSIKISPDGEHLALRVYIDGRHTLRMIRRDNKSVVGGLDVRVAGGRSEVGNYWWVTNTRLVGQILEAPVGSQSPGNYGELFGVDVDGGNQKVLFSQRAHLLESTPGQRNKQKAERAWASFVHRYPPDPDHVLISRKSISPTGDKTPVAMFLNIHDGTLKSKPVAKSVYPDSVFYADENGAIRLIVGTDNKEERQVKARFGDEDWLDLDPSTIGDRFRPVSTIVDGKFFVLDDYELDKQGLYLFDTNSNTQELVYENGRVDISRVHASSDITDVYGLLLYDGLPRYVLLDSKHPEKQIFKDMLSAFSGSVVNIMSRTTDGQYWVVYKHSSIDPGSFYLFDSQQQHLSLLSASKPGLDSNKLSAMEAITFKSFDGMEISGYYTPPVLKVANSPLVVLVHGGPRVRDFWGFNPEVQALATSGYGVLQINFRGSTGYGQLFRDAGNLHWGDDVQQDIIEGTKWLIANRPIDSERVCVMGSSFGAYSAVMSATLAPDLFKCVIANAGVYDLELMYRRGDIKGWYNGKAYLKEAIGDEPENLAQISPVNRIEHLQAPILVAHGKQDRRAPYKHATTLIKALESNRKKHELFIKKNEGHGFYDTANLVEYYEKSLRFLEENVSSTSQ